MESDPPDGDKGVVEPNELDFTRNERVTEIRDGRYIISTGSTSAVSPAVAPAPTDQAFPEADEADDGRLERPASAYGLSITATIEGRRTRREMFSDDITAVFRDLLSWYAVEVSTETPPDEVLGILLLSSGVRVRYPARLLGDVMRRHELGADDTIGDLLAAVADEGFRLPPDR